MSVETQVGPMTLRPWQKKVLHIECALLFSHFSFISKKCIALIFEITFNGAALNVNVDRSPQQQRRNQKKSKKSNIKSV